MKYTDTQLVFTEIPNKVTLAINISNCPNFCVGCHSPELRKDVGKELNEKSLQKLINEHPEINCICFMGGQRDIIKLNCLARLVQKNYKDIETAVYFGCDFIPVEIELKYFNYIKIGHYDDKLGPLGSKTTNQVLYKIKENEELENITSKFWK